MHADQYQGRRVSNMSQNEAMQMLAEVFQEPLDTLTPAHARADLPGWDSMGAMLLLAALDERLGILLTAAEVRGMQSVGDVLQHLRSLGALTD